MTNGTVDIGHLKAEVLPALFADPSRIGEYGGSAGSRSSIDQLSDLMEGGSVSRLAGTIAQLLTNMTDASPERIAKPGSWFSKMFGGELERHTKYHVARKTLDQLLDEAEAQAQGVRDTISSINRLIVSHQAEISHLDAHIKAGRQYLDENPDAGAVAAGSMEFDRPRERLARKLSNLVTLLASHELSISQMKLSRAQAVDLLDRFSETVSVLVPVWRQHTLTLITTKAISPTLVAQASSAHNELMRSLALSLKEIQH
jgi:hypothetical protein